VGEIIKNKCQINLLMKKLISICGSDGDDENLNSYALEVAEKIGRLVAKKVV
jgi:hypothetical protein